MVEVDGHVGRRAAIAAAVLAVAGGCRVSATFTCDESAQCGVDGTCQADGLCSFPDATCPSGSRYGDYSGDLSGTCVGAGTGVGFQFPSSLTDEAVGSHHVSLVLAAPVAETVTVQVEVTGGSADESDALLVNPTITFLPGETRQDVELAIVDDGVEEPDEIVELGLAASTNAEIVHGEHVVTISAVLLPRIQFVDAGSSELESLTAPRLLALTMDRASPIDVIVGVGSSGTASAADHDGIIAVVTVPAGETTAVIQASIVDDVFDEYDETLDVALTAQSGAVIGGLSTHIHTIVDEDPPPTVAFDTAATAGAEAAGAASVAVSIQPASGKLVTVDYAVVGGTAGGAEYTLAAGPLTFAAGTTSRTITITPSDDAIDEDDETVALQLASPVNATLGGIEDHTFAIADDDEAPTLAFAMPNSTPAEDGGTYSVTVTKSAASERVVSFSVVSLPGTAGGADFMASMGPYTIPIGALSVAVPVSITADNVNESDESFSLGLANLVAALPGAPFMHDATIIDDDFSASFTTPGVAAPEGNFGTSMYVYTVSLDTASTLTLTINLNIGGSAAGNDRTVTPNQLTFMPGVATRDVTVTISGDNNGEATETVILTLNPAPHVEIVPPGSLTHTIIDDD